MFIEDCGSYYEGNDLATAQARFLILLSQQGKPLGRDSLRAVVRRTRLHQCGHFMMGRANLFGHSLTLSGSYGADGLVNDVPPEVFQLAVPVPGGLYDAWSHGGGHNTAGAEAPALRTWAHAHIEELMETKKQRRNRLAEAHYV